MTILKVGASPRSALLMFVGLAVLAIGGIVFAGCYLRIMLRSGARHSHHLPSSGPIQPN